MEIHPPVKPRPFGSVARTRIGRERNSRSLRRWVLYWSPGWSVMKIQRAAVPRPRALQKGRRCPPERDLKRPKQTIVACPRRNVEWGTFGSALSSAGGPRRLATDRMPYSFSPSGSLSFSGLDECCGGGCVQVTQGFFRGRGGELYCEGMLLSRVAAAVGTSISGYSRGALRENYSRSARARRLGRRARVLVRVNPDVDPHTHPHISTGRHAHKFGVAWREAVALCLRAATRPELKFLGLG